MGDCLRLLCAAAALFSPRAVVLSSFLFKNIASLQRVDKIAANGKVKFFFGARRFQLNVVCACDDSGTRMYMEVFLHTGRILENHLDCLVSRKTHNDMPVCFHTHVLTEQLPFLPYPLRLKENLVFYSFSIGGKKRTSIFDSGIGLMEAAPRTYALQ